jgi:hypothetical protein
LYTYFSSILFAVIASLLNMHGLLLELRLKFGKYTTAVSTTVTLISLYCYIPHPTT